MNTNISFDKIADLDLVALVIRGDIRATEYLFYQKCDALLQYLIREIFQEQVEKDELVSELYLYLQKNDWIALKSFKGDSKLTTWLSIVATRYLIKKRNSIIEIDKKDTLYGKDFVSQDSDYRLNAYELYDAINKLPNASYRLILLSELQGETTDETINKLGVTAGNFYNLRHKAKKQLSAILKEGEYVRK